MARESTLDSRPGHLRLPPTGAVDERRRGFRHCIGIERAGRDGIERSTNGNDFCGAFGRTVRDGDVSGRMRTRAVLARVFSRDHVRQVLWRACNDVRLLRLRCRKHRQPALSQVIE
jgi:hypothetical protein